ncbi:MAG: LytTR family DNA-binding domain-containing protein [Odoribacter sp.]
MTAIIIEDEPLATLELRDILKDIAPEIEIVACLDSVRESVVWLRENQVDLIFSDIHLGDGQSFDIFKQVEVKVPVIFITAYDEYALEAFKNQGIDYILKPFDREEIRQALEKVKQWFGKITLPVQPVIYRERFLVQIGAKIKSVPVTDIAYFMADGKYLMLYTFDGLGYIIDQTIGGIEGCLDPKLFFRMNRKFIISFASIKEMIRYSNSRIKVILSPLPPENIEAIVSTERIREFKEWLNR